MEADTVEADAAFNHTRAWGIQLMALSYTIESGKYRCGIARIWMQSPAGIARCFKVWYKKNMPFGSDWRNRYGAEESYCDI